MLISITSYRYSGFKFCIQPFLMMDDNPKLSLGSAIRLSIADTNSGDLNSLIELFAKHEQLGWRNSVLAGLLAALYGDQPHNRLSKFISKLKQSDFEDSAYSLEERHLYDAQCALYAFLINCKDKKFLSSKEAFISTFKALTSPHFPEKEIEKLLREYFEKKSPEEYEPPLPPLGKQFKDMGFLCQQGQIAQLRELYPFVTNRSRTHRLVFHATILRSLATLTTEQNSINLEKLNDFMQDFGDTKYLHNLISLITRSNQGEEILKKLGEQKELPDFINFCSSIPCLKMMFGELKQLDSPHTEENNYKPLQPSPGSEHGKQATRKPIKGPRALAR